MNDPILPIPTSNLPEPTGSNGTGEGAQTALAAMIRRRKMGENHIEDVPAEVLPRQNSGV